MDDSDNFEQYDYYDSYGNYSYYTYMDNETLGIYQLARDKSNAVFLYLALPIILFGCLGNLVAFAVLQTRAFQQTSSGFLLSALALADTGVLCTGLLRHWILAVTGDNLDIRALSPGGCKLHTFLTYLLLQLSGWTLVLMTLERLLSVAMPIRAKDICTKARVTLVWTVVLIGLVCVDAHILATMELSDSLAYGNASDNASVGSRKICFHAPQHDFFWRKVWPWLDIIVSNILPGVIILVANIVIVKRLATARRERRLSLRAQREEGQRNTKSVTAMLISISVLFIVTSLPMVVYLLGYPYWPDDTAWDHYNKTMGHVTANLFLYSNFALNFVMYCISGAKFRKALVDMFCCRNTRERRRGGSVSHYSVNTTSSSVRSVQYNRSTSVSSVRSAQYTRSASSHSGVKLVV